MIYLSVQAAAALADERGRAGGLVGLLVWRVLFAAELTRIC
jgi:hypothetical protein